MKISGMIKQYQQSIKASADDAYWFTAMGPGYRWTYPTCSQVAQWLIQTQTTNLPKILSATPLYMPEPSKIYRLQQHDGAHLLSEIRQLKELSKQNFDILLDRINDYETGKLSRTELLKTSDKLAPCLFWNADRNGQLSDVFAALNEPETRLPEDFLLHREAFGEILLSRMFEPFCTTSGSASHGTSAASAEFLEAVAELYQLINPVSDQKSLFSAPFQMLAYNQPGCLSALVKFFVEKQIPARCLAVDVIERFADNQRKSTTTLDETTSAAIFIQVCFDEFRQTNLDFVKQIQFLDWFRRETSFQPEAEVRYYYEGSESLAQLKGDAKLHASQLITQCLQNMLDCSSAEAEALSSSNVLTNLLENHLFEVSTLAELRTVGKLLLNTPSERFKSL